MVGDEDDFAVVWRNWKLRRVDDIEVLYDLTTDPSESIPLDPNAPQHTHVMLQMRALENALPPRL